MSKNGKNELSDNLDSLREVLKEKGYLDNRLEKFFLQRILKSASNFAVNIKFSFIVGCLSSIFMTIPMVFAVLFRNRQLLGNYRDMAVLAVYFFAIFSIAVFAIEFSAGIAIGLLQKVFSRKSDMHSRLASRVAYPVIVAVFAYLVLWWKLGGNTSTAASVIAVSVALLISLIVGRLTSSAAYAYSVKLNSFDVYPVKGRRKVWSMVFLALFLACTGLLLTVSREESEGAEVCDVFEIHDTGIKSILIGIDGLDYESLIDLTESGHLPYLKGLVQSGCLMKTKPVDSYKPPMVWTSIATGCDAEKHGITSFDATTYKGMSVTVQSGILPDQFLSSFLPGWELSVQRPVSSIERKSKAFWEILAEKGLKCGVANWWATWPATNCNGFILSERAFFKFRSGEEHIYDICPEDVLKSSAVPEGDNKGSDFQPQEIDSFYLANAFNICVSMGQQGIDCLAVYLPGLDIFRASALGAESNNGRGSSISGIGRLYEAQLSYCVDLDRMFSRELSRIPDDNTVIIIAGDPGRSSDREESSGFLLMVGKAVKSGMHDAVSQYDICPVILALHGFPFSTEMKGSVPENIFSDLFISEFPLFKINSFGRKEEDSSVARSDKFDEEMMKNLRSLGYL